jgi:hypothetical protein
VNKRSGGKNSGKVDNKISKSEKPGLLKGGPGHAYPKNGQEVSRWEKTVDDAGYTWANGKKSYPCCLGVSQHRAWCTVNEPLKLSSAAIAENKKRKDRKNTAEIARQRKKQKSNA